MAYSKAFTKRDRRESDLLLEVVFAHMAFSSSKNHRQRLEAHSRFREAVRVLHEFMDEEKREKAGA